jgi:rod shape determining protein RodA
LFLSRQQRRPDAIIIFCVFILLTFGLLALYSATASSQPELFRINFSKQILWIGVGLAVAVFFAVLPIGVYKEVAYLLYILSLITLIIVALAGRFFTSTRWLTIGQINWQPSEFAKIGIILALARFLGEHKRSPHSIKTVLLAFTIVVLPFILVVQQPDLATALVYFAILIPMLYWAGLGNFVIFVIASPMIVFFASFNFYTFTIVMVLISIALYLFRRGALVFWCVFLVNVVVGILAPVLWNQLKPYQQQRILAYLGLVSDPHGISYQIIQSKVAIGSGGLVGKGFLQGTQTQLRFLPAQHTDFVISVVAEEFGFIAILLILMAFLILMFRGVSIADSTRDKFSSLMVIGIISALTFQIVVNIGMATAVVPVAGVPLPFLSYGGSSMLVTLTMVALLHNVASRR